MLCVAKTKALISLAVTAKLICTFVFAYAKSWFSHDAAHKAVGRKHLSVWEQMATDQHEPLLAHLS